MTFVTLWPKGARRLAKGAQASRSLWAKRLASRGSPPKGFWAGLGCDYLSDFPYSAVIYTNVRALVSAAPSRGSSYFSWGGSASQGPTFLLGQKKESLLIGHVVAARISCDQSPWPPSQQQIAHVRETQQAIIAR